MSDYRIFQILNTLIVYPLKWREPQDPPLPLEARRNPRRRWMAGGLAWLGRRMVALGEGLQARYGRAVEAPIPPVSHRPGVAP